MANNPNFAALLDKPAESVERPKPLPAYTYQCVVKGLPENGESTLKKTPFVRFNLSPMAAIGEFDQAEIDAIGGLEGKTIRDTYYVTEDALYRLKEFLTNCGIEAEDKSIAQMISEAPGCQILVTIRHRSSEDGSSIFAEVAKTAAVE